MATLQTSENAAAVANNAPSGSESNGNKADGKAPQQKQQPKLPAAEAGGDAPKKLSGAELKALKQAEKAKRRAAVIAAKEAGAGGAAAPKGDGGSKQQKPAPSSGSGSGGGGGQGKAKGKQDVTGAAAGGEAGRISGPLAHRGSTAAAGAATNVGTAAAASGDREKDPRSGIPECFSHLPMAKRISLSQAHKDVHPAVLAVGQQMAAFTLRDCMARLEATLVAFKKVIQSYQTPPGTAFSRHFVSHVLNPQIEYLTECRPMCFAMGNGIRLLKARVAQLDLDLDDRAAIAELCDAVDGFVQERIFAAAVGIAREAAGLLRDGDVVLTYGDPAAGQALAKHFRPRRDRASTPTGVESAEADRAGGGGCRSVVYSPSLDGLDHHVAQATKVLLGVEAVFANGALLAPAGTYDVALAAGAQGCPVIALSETVSFDRDRVATDALAHNEIDPDHCDADSFRLLFDTTPSSLVSMLICEYEEASGTVPAHAINQVMRTREDPN
ncbi:translation initiation factor eif-2b delta subunit [Niveomyces insectorum RCEF 264]|uniref:Translation initiation factor eIF2B subunit delta n=1 Tax=Niveomyces insectorum RCEF 264 TaxID=1081102 RepID=A0A162JCA8_9HYPO|nr:translation initiation factor eif-2b delta subunit [Niveomyces insectorum RCEF 264]